MLRYGMVWYVMSCHKAYFFVYYVMLWYVVFFKSLILCNTESRVALPLMSHRHDNENYLCCSVLTQGRGGS